MWNKILISKLSLLLIIVILNYIFQVIIFKKLYNKNNFYFISS